MIFSSKITDSVIIKNNSGKSYTFLSKAGISLLNTYNVVKVDDYAAECILILNNNITLTQKTAAESADATGIYFINRNDSKIPVVIGNQSAKTTKVLFKVHKDADISAYGWQSSSNLKIGGVFMRRNFTVSANNLYDGSMYGANAYGIYAAKKIESAANFTGNFSITARGEGNVNAAAVYAAAGNFSAGNLIGKFKVTADSDDSIANVYGVYANSITLNKVSSKFDIMSDGDQSSNNKAAALYSVSALKIFNGFTGSIKVRTEESAENYGFYADSIQLRGRNTGSVAITADNDHDSMAYGICSAGEMDLANYSGALSVKAIAEDYNASATAYGTKASDLKYVGTFSGKITVSASNKNKRAGNAYAYGIYANDIESDDITGTWKITAKACNGNAYGLYSANDISMDDLSGSKTVSGVDGGYGFFSGQGNFSADNISGKITVSARSIAYGFSGADYFAADDMSKMTLKVTASAGSAYGIQAGNVKISDAGLNVGKITVSGSADAYGVKIDLAVNNDADSCLNKEISGNISVVSKKGSAYGISVDTFNDITLAAGITASGYDNARAVVFENGNLSLDSAKITAKTTQKGNVDIAYAVVAGAAANVIKIAGKSKVTGYIDGGTGTDYVGIESGSRLTGGLKNVENLIFLVNDASQKKKAVWSAAAADQVSSIGIKSDFGLRGDFKLVTKNRKNSWEEIFGVLPSSLNIPDDDLYSYSFYEKGNDLYIRIKLRDTLSDKAEVFNTKITSAAETLKQNSLFTEKADIVLKDAAVNYAVLADKSKALVLDNNITVSKSAGDVYGIKSSDIQSLSANNAVKTLKVTAKAGNAFGYHSQNDFVVNGKYFLQNITISAANSADKTESNGIYVSNKFTADEISKKFTISAKSTYAEAEAFGIYCYELAVNKFSGKFDIKLTANSKYGAVSKAAAILVRSKLSIKNGFTGSIKINAKDAAGKLEVYGMKKDTASSSFEMLGKNTGSISINATGGTSVKAYGICGIYLAAEGMKLANYSGAITIKAVSADASAAAICAETNLLGPGDDISVDIEGKFTSKLNVSAKGTGANSKVSAFGISNNGTSVSMDDITGTWNISATADIANAYGIYTVNGGDVSVGNISGTKKITAKSKNISASSYTAFISAQDSFSADTVSGKVTVSGTGETIGFYSGGNFAVDDMSKMTLKVNSSNSNAYGIKAVSYSLSDGKFELDDSGLNLGKISVAGSKNVYGLHVEYGSIYAADTCLNNRLTGSISAVSKTEAAYGISADKFENTVCSVNISATGKKYACAVEITEGDLIVDSAKITAKVTGKNEIHKYAVYTTDLEDNKIRICGKSKVTGHIYTGGNADEDFVYIESGSKFTGALSNVECINLILNDAAQAKNSLWDVNAFADMTQARLWLDIDYGMSGNFTLATKKSSQQWSDIVNLDDNYANVVLNVDDKSFNLGSGGCIYGDFSYQLKEQGNKLILAVTEAL